MPGAPTAAGPHGLHAISDCMEETIDTATFNKKADPPHPAVEMANEEKVQEKQRLKPLRKKLPVTKLHCEKSHNCVCGGQDNNGDDRNVSVHMQQPVKKCQAAMPIKAPLEDLSL